MRKAKEIHKGKVLNETHTFLNDSEGNNNTCRMLENENRPSGNAIVSGLHLLGGTQRYNTPAAVSRQHKKRKYCIERLSKWRRLYENMQSCYNF
jgi:hypothetical protein